MKGRRDLKSEHLRLSISPRKPVVVINNGNCIEWNAIWSEIKRVITKSQNHDL